MLENRQMNEKGIISVFSLLDWAEFFLLNRKAEQLPPNTVDFSRKNVKKFNEFYLLEKIQDLQDIDATSIQILILWLDNLEHNSRDVHAHFCVLRNFLN